MRPDLDRLSARERDALRLLAQGFDAKSAAQWLGMSVHTLNDRLHGARQKLGVSGSREAARLLAGSDRLPPDTSAPGAPPNSSAPEESGWPIFPIHGWMRTGPPSGPQAADACCS